MKRISVLIAVVMIMAIPVLANIDQKATLNGETSGESNVDVDQVAWNYGSGNISQNIGINITGNEQILEQDGTVVILDSDYADDINNTINGHNLIKIDLSQYGKNTGSGDIDQGIKILVENNFQMLDQRSNVEISASDYTGYVNNTIRGLNLINIDSSQRGENTGSGNIDQGIDVTASGNKQILDQSNKVRIGPSDSDLDGHINSTIDGLNLINYKLKQIGRNTGSLDVAQKIGNLIGESLQELSQTVGVFIWDTPTDTPEPIVIVVSGPTTTLTATPTPEQREGGV